MKTHDPKNFTEAFVQEFVDLFNKQGDFKTTSSDVKISHNIGSSLSYWFHFWVEGKRSVPLIPPLRPAKSGPYPEVPQREANPSSLLNKTSNRNYSGYAYLKSSIRQNPRLMYFGGDCMRISNNVQVMPSTGETKGKLWMPKGNTETKIPQSSILISTKRPSEIHELTRPQSPSYLPAVSNIGEDVDD